MNTIKTLFDTITKNRIVTHILFWTVLIGTTTYLTSLNYGLYRRHFLTNMALLPTQLAASYFLVYFQIPHLVFKKKYFLFLVSIVISVFIITVLARLSVVYLAEPFIREDFEQESLIEVLSDPRYLLLVYFPAVYVFPLVFLSVKSIKDRFEEKNQLEILLKEKVTTELNFLKAQIHPHFLFNTLNNLYSLTLDKSEAAPEVIIKLSDMLDYMLYQCSDPTVLISKEIILIQNYIDLELLRYDEKLDLIFEHHIEDEQSRIAPLILLSIVENAFKHGVSGNLINPKVHILLREQKKQLYFKVFNTKPPIEHTLNQTTKKGVGAHNVKRQLDLIYQNRYDLNIKETDEHYSLVLEIRLLE